MRWVGPRSIVALACCVLWTTVVAALPRWTAAQKQHPTAAVEPSCDTPHAVLESFLQQQQQQPDAGRFKIQGWRWHTMSLIRESTRLAAALQTKRPLSLLQTAVDHVVDFNLQGLDRIQTAVFFPWVRQQIAQRAEPSVATAFQTVMDELEAQAATALVLGQKLVSLATDGCGNK